jgi:diguanylate cyclase (GGDEF)-like protein
LEALNDQLYSQARQLRNSEANYRALLENNLDAILVVDKSGIIRFANPAAQELLLRPRHELINSPCEFLLLAGDVREIDIPRADGDAVVAQLRVVETFWEGEVAYLASLHDITERKRYERKIHEQQMKLQEANTTLQALATLDGMTGLLNRRAFGEKMLDEMRRSARYGWPLSVLLMDVDKFKQYNDTFGHPAGDEVLKSVARLLQEQARSSDIVARYGGEEFIALLPNTDREAAHILAERVRVAIESAPWVERAITVSIGIATMTPQVVGDAALLTEADRLIETADQALYRSKENGRNRVTQA